MHLLGHVLVGCHLVLEPVALLLISHRRHEVVVVREIVQAVERRGVLEAFDQHALLSEGVVVKGTVDLIHALFLGPFLRGRKQELRHFEVINGVEPSESRPLLRVEFVVAGVHHRANPSHDFGFGRGFPSFAIDCEPHLVCAVRECRHGGEGLLLVSVKGRHILGAFPVQFVGEFDESFEVPAGGDFNDTVIWHDGKCWHRSGVCRNQSANIVKNPQLALFE